jgi:hypothetical protein
MRAPIQPVPVQPPRYGLLVAATVTPLSTDRWQQGVTWNPEQCGVSGRVSVGCEGDTDEIVAERNGGIVEADPFAVWAADECSPFGFGARDWTGRVLRQLEATQSYQIANELWTGELHIDDSLSGGWLTDHTTLNYSFQADNVIDALGCLEQGLAVCGQGRRGMIHVTPQALVHLSAATAVETVGSTILTPLGNVVVADAGYDGSGPGGVPADSTTQWMYATSMIDVVLEPNPMLIPGEIEQAQALAQALDRSDNTITVRAFRMAMYRWDRCCHIAVEVDLPVCVVAS